MKRASRLIYISMKLGQRGPHKRAVHAEIGNLSPTCRPLPGFEAALMGERGRRGT